MLHFHASALRFLAQSISLKTNLRLKAPKQLFSLLLILSLLVSVIPFGFGKSDALEKSRSAKRQNETVSVTDPPVPFNFPKDGKTEREKGSKGEGEKEANSLVSIRDSVSSF